MSDARHQMDIKEAAVAVANQRMRAEVLPRAVSLLLGREPGTMGALLQEWNPYMLDPTTGFEAALKIADPIVLAVMRDAGLLAESKRIMSEELQRCMFESRLTRGLLQVVLEDLIAPERPIYQEAERWA